VRRGAAQDAASRWDVSGPAPASPTDSNSPHHRHRRAARARLGRGL